MDLAYRRLEPTCCPIACGRRAHFKHTWALELGEVPWVPTVCRPPVC